MNPANLTVLQPDVALRRDPRRAAGARRRPSIGSSSPSPSTLCTAKSNAIGAPAATVTGSARRSGKYSSVNCSSRSSTPRSRSQPPPDPRGHERHQHEDDEQPPDQVAAAVRPASRRATRSLGPTSSCCPMHCSPMALPRPPPGFAALAPPVAPTATGALMRSRRRGPEARLPPRRARTRSTSAVAGDRTVGQGT